MFESFFAVMYFSDQEGIAKVIQGYQAKMKLECVVLTIRTTLNPEVYSQFPIVSLTDPEQDLKRWMREDGHGTTFDTGCTVIVTKAENLNKEIERKFKNLLWIVLDRLPNNAKLNVEWPVMELFPNLVAARCSFTEAKLVSFYDK